MKDTVWELFSKTGNPAYYMLYKALGEENGVKHKSNHSDSNRLSGK